LRKFVLSIYLAPLGLGDQFAQWTQGVALGYPISPRWG